MDEKWKSCSRRIFCGAFCLRRRSFVNLWEPVLPAVHFDLANQVQVVLGIFQYLSVFSSILQYFPVVFNVFQYFLVFFSIFQYFSVFFSIQRLYHHHCWSIFLNHQIVKGDFCASFWNSLGLWEWSKLLTLYIFTSSFLFTKKSDSRVSLVGPQWCSEEVDPAWRLCLFYVLLYYMRSLLHIFCNTCMFSITCLLCILYYLYVLFYMRSL